MIKIGAASLPLFSFAVRAARAGKQGRGFAAVASELRSLAQRSDAALVELSAAAAESLKQQAARMTESAAVFRLV